MDYGVCIDADPTTAYYYYISRGTIAGEFQEPTSLD
jgi:hypothetical protein